MEEDSFSSLEWVDNGLTKSCLTQKQSGRLCHNLRTRITREKDEKAGEQRRNKAELAAENNCLCPRIQNPVPEATRDWRFCIGYSQSKQTYYTPPGEAERGV